jgi:hypothetical protein
VDFHLDTPRSAFDEKDLGRFRDLANYQGLLRYLIELYEFCQWGFRTDMTTRLIPNSDSDRTWHRKRLSFFHHSLDFTKKNFLNSEWLPVKTVE